MKLFNLDNSPLMDVNAISRDNNDLIIKGTIMGAMPMTCKLTPAEARGMLKMLTPGLVFFLLTFLFRSSARVPRN
ncbi:hypothetical protein EZH22_02035 [Xanthobacter dioxanivorans]|uniref:Uncharacterized protein n=1 Tax=Xanthobacter dioxanivorans TaxID=2528964 RepID=A0A974PP88_9HYPH|nr:hypothetical protein [Xanthobacter dioxanivorans]QRG07243.1 hypothetical protein EZH22_02035 [Xanthobacter dioxanivorans]